ncbi:MAG: cyclic nucleotide-binding domain-containing protein [Clostridiales bacterium]|nr:cyclic nucleotide-binding domain-containing protein [Clostridiales bacterium]
MRFYKDTKQIEYYLKKYDVKKMFTDKDSYRQNFVMVEIRRHENIDHNAYNNYLFFMVEGRFKVYSNLSNGKKLLLYFSRKFEIMGDLEFLRIKNHNVTTEAIEHTVCLALDISQIRDRLLKDTVFLKTLLYQVGEKLAKSSSNIAINMLYPVENRLSSYIRYMAQDNGTNTGKYFEANLTETAEVLGTSYRQLQRVLKALCAQNILQKNKGRYEIVDEERLNILSGDIYM